MRFKCASELEQYLEQERKVEKLTIALDPCPAEMNGDFTVNCFKIAKSVRANPKELAEQAETFLNTHADVQNVERVKAFLNVTLTPSALFHDAIDAAQKPAPADGTKRYLVEFSAPNTNKPQHLGHVRNNTLGMAICGILKALGHTVIPVNLVNDRGIAICKSMLAYQRYGENCTPESAGMKGDHLIGTFYVRFDQELRRQVQALREAQPELAEKKDDELFLQTEIGRATQDMLNKWEAGDPEVRRLWRQLNDWVIAGFEATYRLYGVAFEHTYYESDTYLLGKELVQKGLNDGIFQQEPDGAVSIDLSDEKLGRKILLRNDGTSLYTTQDLGTTLLKYEDFKPERMVWVVGDEQIHHFKTLFATLRKMGYPWANDLYHLAYGMVNLPHGKMKSREGTVVDADDLYQGMLTLARAATAERYEDLDAEELNQRARGIALAALKFMLLKVNAGTTIKFDPDAAIKFEGDTGPCVLYAYARIASICRRLPNSELAEHGDWAMLTEEAERRLAVRCALYADVLQRAGANLDPSCLAGYLIDLTRDFNRFYKKHSVLNAETPILRRTRLNLCLRVQEILRAGLNSLGIDPLEAM